MLKFTNIICTAISAVLWLAGIYLCIKGVYSTGLPFIISAILSAPPSELLLSKVIRKQDSKDTILIGRNSFVIIATAAILLYLNSINITPSVLYSSIRDMENPMSYSETTFLTSEGVSPGGNHQNKESSIDVPDSNLDISQGAPITDSVFTFYEQLKTEIELSAEQGQAILEDLANSNPYSESNTEHNTDVTGNNPLPSGEDNPTDTTPPSSEETEPNNATSHGSNDIKTTGLEVHFIDVGQGDAALILCDNEAILIDTGIEDNGTKLQNYIQKQGVKTIKTLILTHPDADHIGSADVIINKFDIEQVFMPEYEKDTYTYRDTMDALSYKRLTPAMPEIGSTHSVGSATYTILAPLQSYEDANNNSIVLKLEYGNTSFLFTGDAATESESAMLASGADLSADVLKVGHHGSKYSSSEDFISAVSPTYALISCAEGNEYYHPHATALNILRAAGVKLFRTDEQGTVIATSDGETIKFNCAPSETWQSG